MLESILVGLKDWLPASAVLVATVVTLALAHWMLNRSKGRRNKGSFGRQLTLLGLTLIGLIAVLVNLPVGDEVRGQLLSLLGILLSATIALASTTLIGNMMAGLMIRAIGSFKPGDFIQVEESFGRVTERGLVHTEIQTEDRDLMTLPNLFLATHPVKVVRSDGTMVSGQVSLGYDVPHPNIVEQLVRAAEEVGLEDPFVRVIELGDFSVTYRVSGLLVEVRELVSIRSKLLTAMLDTLHGANIEIVSPSFMTTRALGSQAHILPAGDSKKPRNAESSPEGVIFDKADQATVESLREELETSEKRQLELQAKLEKLTDEERAELSDLEEAINKSRVTITDYEATRSDSADPGKRNQE